MATISGKIDLLKLKGARRVQDGNVKGIFIPIYDNPAIYAEGKGAYLAVRIVNKVMQYKDVTYTHFIAADLTKEQRDTILDQYGEDALRAAAPILGNCREWQRPEPEYEQTRLRADNGLSSPDGFAPQADDLPFDSPQR